MFAIARASTSTRSFSMLRFFASVRPSRRPHNSATIEYVCPIFLEQLLIQEPLASLMMPIALAPPGFPRAEPSVFNLKKPGGGLFPTYEFCGFLLNSELGREGIEKVRGSRNDLSEDIIAVKLKGLP